MITDINLSSDIIAEGVPNGTIIGTFVAVDDDEITTHTLYLIDDDEGRFKVDGTNLIVRDTTRIDYETSTSHNIEVRATDNSDNTFDKVFTINITNSILAAEIHTISPKASKEGTNPEVVITGQHFAEGGEPTVRIDGDPITINSYTDTMISFVLTDDLPAKVYTVTVFNGIGL